VKPKALTPPSVSAQLQVPPTTTPVPQPSRARPTLQDARPFPLLGGPDQLPSPNVKQRLNLLLEEDRSAIRTWAKESLTLIDTLPMGLIPVHLEHLERFERAARVARVAVPNFEPPKPNTAQVCVFDGPIARIRIGKRKGTGGKVLRLAVGSQEMKFDLQTGELSGAADPLSAFVMPEALARLGGSK